MIREKPVSRVELPIGQLALPAPRQLQGGKIIPFIAEGFGLGSPNSPTMTDPKHLAVLLALLNTVAFLLFAIDKLLAKAAKRRISERLLILVTLPMASPGSLLGMVIFNHKTAKPKFRYGVPALLLAQSALGYWVTYA